MTEKQKKDGAIKLTFSMEIPPETIGKIIEAIPPEARQQLFIDSPNTFFKAFAEAASDHIIKSWQSSPEQWTKWITAFSQAAKNNVPAPEETPNTQLPWPWNMMFQPPKK